MACRLGELFRGGLCGWWEDWEESSAEDFLNLFVMAVTRRDAWRCCLYMKGNHLVDRTTIHRHAGDTHMADPIERWSMVYQRESAGLIRFASIFAGPTGAEDVVSEAMIRILDRPDVMALPADELTPYLYRTVANTAKNHLRSSGRRRRREEHVARAEINLTVVGSEPGVDPRIVSAMSTLSVQQQAVIFLTYWTDLPVAEVASYLDVSSGTVKRQLARGRAKLGKALS